VGLRSLSGLSLSDGLHYECIQRMPMSPGGSQVVRVHLVRNTPTSRSPQCCAAGSDGKVHFYDIATGQRTLVYRAYPEGEGGVRGIDFAHEERFFLTIGNQNTVKLWSRQRVDRPVAIYQTGARPTSLCCHPTIETRFFLGFHTGELHVFDASTGHSVELDLALYGSDSPINTICCSPGGKYVVCADNDCFLTVLKNCGHGGKYEVIKRHHLQCRKITGLVYCASQRAVVASCCDNKMRLLLVPSLELVHVFFHPHSSQEIHAALTRNSGLAVTGSEDCGIRFFDVATATLFTTLQGMSSPVTSVDLSNDDELLVAGCVDCVAVWRRKDPLGSS